MLHRTLTHQTASVRRALLSPLGGARALLLPRENCLKTRLSILKLKSCSFVKDSTGRRIHRESMDSVVGKNSSKTQRQGSHLESPATEAPDPYNLKRFTIQQQHYQPIAIKELLQARKSTHWAWYILPTPPFLRFGKRVGSPINQEYELAHAAETRAYLRYEHDGVSLRDNYLEVLRVITKQLKAGYDAYDLVGYDRSRLVASVKHFAAVAQEAGDTTKDPFDKEVYDACIQVMDLL